MKSLHPTQKALLGLLEKNLAAPLTIREIQDELGLSSPSLVSHHVQQLERKGYLRRNPSNPQDYKLLKSPEQPIVLLNMYGLAQCGPDGSLLTGDPLDTIRVSTKLLSFPAAEAFLVRANGSSMKPLIGEGDLVLARITSEAPDGSLVVCINEGKCLIKRFHKSGSHILLESENSSEFPTFIADSDDFKIEGIVKAVMSTIS